MHPEVRPPPPVERLLREVERLMAKTKDKELGRNKIFSHDIKHIHGCKVGYMDPELFLSLCDKYKIDEKQCELLFLETVRRSVPHVPLKSGTAFLPLGPRHGFTSSKGGVYQGEYHPTSNTHRLKYMPMRSGEFFCTYPKDMLFFAPRDAAKFSTIAFTTPKMTQEDKTHEMLHFPESLVSADEEHAIVIL